MRVPVFFLLAIAILSFLAPPAAAAEISFTEIAWMGTLPKEGESAQASANNEWIEIFNSGVSAVSLEGWIINALDGAPSIALSGNLGAGNYVILERASDDVLPQVAADIVYPYKDNALSNGGEHLFLKDAAGNIADEVSAASGWPAGDNITKETMQRAGTVWITAVATPRAGGSGSVPPSIPPPPEPPSSAPPPPPSYSSGSGGHAAATTSITAYADGNTTVIAGAASLFTGSAFGLKGEPLFAARFHWNFGDGATGEGRVVSHVFSIIGVYRVGLYITSGEYAAADFLTIKVIPNQLRVVEVIGGERGFIRLANNADAEIDVGGWIIEDGFGNRFTLPAETKIAARAQTAFSNATTGLFQNASSTAVLLRFVNGMEALRYEEGAASTSVVFSPPPSPLPSPFQVSRVVPFSSLSSQEEKKKEKENSSDTAVGASAILAVAAETSSPLESATSAEKTSFSGQPSENSSSAARFFFAAFFLAVLAAGGYLFVRIGF